MFPGAGSTQWVHGTWNKQKVLRSVYALGFTVVLSDADVVWLTDPMPDLELLEKEPVHMMFSTDLTETLNTKAGLLYENKSQPYVSVNTGECDVGESQVPSVPACLQCHA